MTDPLTAALERRWARHIAAAGLDPAAAETLFSEILHAHREPHRRYHAVEHLLEVFEALETDAPALEEPLRAAFAVWFHDIVYDTQAPDNEARSADRARTRLSALDVDAGLVDRVARLIEATADHAATPSDATDAAFLDADIAILGAPAPRYDRYAADVRDEYGWVDDALWTAGRGAFLDKQLARTRLYHTDSAQARLGGMARSNMARERAALGD